jgi:hypothetical protein
LRDAWHVPLAPQNQLPDHGEQVVAARREVVLVARRTFLIAAPLHEAALLEAPEALGEDVGRDALWRAEKIREPVLVVEQKIADDQHSG